MIPYENVIEIEDAPCTRCQRPVHLQHDPPCDCGDVYCADCDPCVVCFPIEVPC